MARWRIEKKQAVLIIACAIGLAVSVSTVFLSAFSQFFRPLAAEFGWTRGQLSLAFSLAALCITLATPIAGKLITRLGVRRILVPSIICFALFMASIAFMAHGYWTYLILISLTALAGAGTNTFVYLSVLPSWFSDRLGLMLGLAMTGIGIGQAFSPILAQYLISHFGWREAYAALAVLSAVVALPGALLIVRNNPARDAEMRAPKEGARASEPAVITWGDRRFWPLGVTFFGIALCASGCAVHVAPILIDKGFDPMQAATIGSSGGVAILVGRLVAGYLLDRLGPLVVGCITCVCAAAAPQLLSGWVDPRLAMLAPILFGLAIGAEGDLMPFTLRQIFGLNGYAEIYGRLFTLFSLGVLLGPLVMGAIFDRFGSYDPVLMFFTLASVAVFPVFASVLRDGREREAAI